jgi:CheY-like chemotaxis protein
MSNPPRILAVEPDRTHALALKRFVQSCIDADLVVVDSVASAKAAIAEQVPQAVLVSELVSPDDDVDLTAHLRSRVPGRPLPILAVPAMGGGDDELSPAPRGLLRLIASGGALTDAPRLQMARRQAALRHALQAIVDLAVSPAGATAIAPQRPRAPRWKGDNIPWLTRVTMPLGLEVRLVNISRSGLLIESRGHFVTGQPAAFELHGRLRVVVPGRFVRSTVAVAANGPSDGAIYHSAALFDDDLPLFAPHASGLYGSTIVPNDLGEVLVWVRGQARSGMRPERIRAAFELSVQELVGARAVLICRAPAQADEPGDSVCLPVPTTDGSVAFLQAIYDTARPPSTHAFEQLQAAAMLAADVLEIEHTSKVAEH